MNLLRCYIPVFIICFSFVACSQPSSETSNYVQDSIFAIAENNGSIELPKGFAAILVADDLGNARHLDVNAAGDVYVRLGSVGLKGSVVALRDKTGNGQANEKEYLGFKGGTGIKVHNGYLYYSTNTDVYRRKFNSDELLPSGEEELIVSVPRQSQHAAKPITFDDQGHLYMTIGAPSNACQSPDRQPGVKGQDPCPLLDEHAGIWRFDADVKNQKLADGIRYATGIRHAVGIRWSESNQVLYAMQHGRDQLHQFWPDLYSEQQSAELPSEEMFEIQEGDDFGWPYCYYDVDKSQKVLNPEYGGDGNLVGRCVDKEKPILAFPGHWAPNDILIYEGLQFPSTYKGGAFVAFHGSWNRAPLPQQGYKVVFVPFENGKPTGDYKDFATEFANDGGVLDSPGDAEFRPCGLAVGPEGSLYICDSVRGRVWRIVYVGEE